MTTRRASRPKYVRAVDTYRASRDRSKVLRRAMVAELAAARAAGVSVDDMAAALGLHRSRVYQLLEGGDSE